MHACAASAHAGFLPRFPNRLWEVGCEGLPAGSLPTTLSPCTPPAGKAPQGSAPHGRARVGAPDPPSRAGWVQAGFSLCLCRGVPAQPGAPGPSRPTALFPMAYKGERFLIFFVLLFFPLFKEKKNTS